MLVDIESKGREFVLYTSYRYLFLSEWVLKLYKFSNQLKLQCSKQYIVHKTLQRDMSQPL